MDIARETVDIVLAGHEPYPAVAVDCYWNLLTANRAIGTMLEGIPAALMQPPVNVFRLTLHPGGLAPRIVNYAEWREHILNRVHRQASVTGDLAYTEPIDQLWSFPAPEGPEEIKPDRLSAGPDLATSLRLRTNHGVLSFVYATPVFGSAVEVTLSGLTIESFFPANREAVTILRRLSSAMGTPLPAEDRSTSDLRSG
jgi:hypothetical protein